MEPFTKLSMECKPEVEALLSELKGFDETQKSYILGVINGTSAQIARQQKLQSAPISAQFSPN